MRFFLTCLTMTALFFSCQSVVEIDLQNESKLVIEAYLRSDDSVQVRVSSSANLTARTTKSLDDLELYILHLDRKYALQRTDIDYFSSVYSIAKSVFTTPAAGLLQLEAH